MPLNPQHFQQFIDGTLKFVEVASFGMKRACDELVVHRSMQKKASDLAPEVLAFMLKTGAVREDQKDAAAAMLGSHAETLQLLKSAVDELFKLRSGQAQKKAGDLGRGVDDPNAKQAGDYDSMTDPHVGRKTSQKKASDLAILKVLDQPDR